MKVDPQVVEARVSELLMSLGLDLKEPGLAATPNRVAKMFTQELFRGLYTEPPKLTAFPNENQYNQMVVLRDVRVVSVCEHHLLPFRGRAHVAYIPSPIGQVCGVSKLARVVDWFARRPQIQERLTEQVVDFLQEQLSPQGVMAVFEAQHECMLCRGVMEDQAVMVTSAFRGVFEAGEVREEFMSLIKG